MKNIINIFPAALAALLLANACEKPVEKPLPEPELIPTLAVKSVTDSSVVISASAGDVLDKSYYFNVMTVAEYEECGGDDAILAMGEQYIPEIRRDLCYGDNEREFAGLFPETEYYVYSFALSREGEAGDTVVKESFTTPARVYPEFKAEINADVIRSFMMTVVFNVEDINELFTFVAIPSAEYDKSSKDIDYLQQYFDAIVESNLDPDYGIDRATVLKAMIYTGGGGIGNLMYLTPDTKYEVVLMRMTEDGKVTGFISETLSTVKHVYSEASFECVFDKYYDAAYLGYPGNAAVPMEFVKNDKAASWILAAYRADYSTEALLSDHMAYSMVLVNENAVTDVPSIVYLLPWDTDITLLGFAMDNGQNLGEVVRTKMRLTKDGASDIHDYLLPEDATFAVMSPKKEVRSVFVPKISYSL